MRLYFAPTQSSIPNPMLTPGRRQRQLSGRRAFSLMEIIIVVSIMAIIAVISIPQLARIASASQLTASANMVIDSLNLARQTAMTKNRPVEFRLYKATSTVSPTIKYYRAVQVLNLPDYSKSLTAESTPISMVQFLSGAVIVTETPMFSTFFDDPSATYRGAAKNVAIDNTNANVDYIAFRFLPNGSTDLSPAGPSTAQSQWTLTLRSAHEKETGSAPGKNYVTVHIDPVIGTIRSYRP